MPWYSLDEAANRVELPDEWRDSIIAGSDNVAEFAAEMLIKRVKLTGACAVAFDGYLGVDWGVIVSKVSGLLESRGFAVRCLDVADCYKSPETIEEMVSPCLTSDPYFGTVFDGDLTEFFDQAMLAGLRLNVRKLIGRVGTGKPLCDVVILHGSGAAMTSLAATCQSIFYFDICREKIVDRIEKSISRPLAAADGTTSAKLPFKRLYYVDYGVLNKHKKQVLGRMDYYVDANNKEDMRLLPRATFDGLLALMTEQPFRAKPVYIPGVWGGQEMKKIRGLPESMVNCAFALELIPQEQSVRIDVGHTVIEMPFVNLVWRERKRLMGETAARRFGDYFPITLNYDDTSGGGHLAIQVHPHGKYLRDKFNERMRRDESYYCVRAWDGARTYHGIKKQTDLHELKRLCAQAENSGVTFDHDDYINSWSSRPGDLFLIPAGTIHASGRNQLVLEIDSDPSKNSAEYTFHLYDYLRPNLDGSKRAIHLGHAFNVIRSGRRTDWVGRNLRQKPRLVRGGDGWAEYLIGRRRDMYYEVRRLEFSREIAGDTAGGFHILTLVDGESVRVVSAKHPGRNVTIRFTETVVLPANLGEYVVENLGSGCCKLTKALLKSDE